MTRSVDIDLSILDATEQVGDRQVVSVFQSSRQEIYVFYIDSNADLVYDKSINGGNTWAGLTIIDATDDYIECSVWYDRWTPGDTTGNTIHIVAANNTDNSMIYFSLGVDDDTAETDNNVLIFADTTISTNPRLAICKASGGNLFVIGQFTTTKQYTAHKSTDSGTNWTDISSPAGGTDFGAIFNDNDDRLSLVPFNTDADIMAWGVDSSPADMLYIIYDEVSDEWDEKVIVAKNESWGSGDQYNNACVEKGTGDIYMMGLMDGGSNGGGGHVIWKVADSDHTLTGSWTVRPETGSGVGEATLHLEIRGTALSYHEPTGCFIAAYLEGDNNTSMQPVYQISSDNCKTWSAPYRGFHANTEGQDDLRSIWMAHTYLNAAEGVNMVWTNDDLDHIITLTWPFFLTTIDGVVKDDAGSAVSGAYVKAWKNGYSGANYIWNPFVGAAVTDGSGNYSIGVISQEGESGQANNYHIVADDQINIGCQYSEDWQYGGVDPDNGTVYTSTATELTLDHTNKELDFAAGTTTADNWSWNIGNFIAGDQETLANFWKIRFKIRLDTVTQGASTTQSGFYVYLALGANTPDSAAHDFVGMRFTMTDTENVITAITNFTSAPSAGAASVTDFTHALTAETLFVEMVGDGHAGTSNSTFSIRLYSDEFGTLIEEKTGLANPVSQTLDFLTFGVEGGDTGNIITGALEWWQFWPKSGQTEHGVNIKTANATDSALPFGVGTA